MTTEPEAIPAVDELAQEIRRVDGSNSLGAGALAEALMPFLIRASRAPVDGTGWRPIETAPKDGTHFLACHGDYTDLWTFSQRPPVVAHWWGGEGEEGFYQSSGIVEGSYNDHPIYSDWWMPLPAAPGTHPGTVDGAEAKPDRWELLETLDSGSIRWSVFEHRQQAHNAMVASDFVAVIRPLYPHPAPASPDVDWRDDPSADERWNAGLDFGMEQLCKAIGVDPQQVTWDAATETVDGDVRSVIWNILRTAYGEDFPPAPSPDAEMVTALTDLLSWFPDQPSKPEWRLEAGRYGADDAISAARALLSKRGGDR